MKKHELFIKLANPNANGISRWVNTSEFIGEYSSLELLNGLSWGRKSSTLARKYNVETDKNVTPGVKIDRIRLNGFNSKKTFNQYIRQDIKDLYRTQNCVMLGIVGNSVNTKIEIDHKDGRKEDDRVSNASTQDFSDFQPLCKAANDVKRQICKRCKETNMRWNATNLRGNPFDFYMGDENYTKELGCKGCYQYDPVEYRKTVVVKVSKMATKEAVDAVFNKLYPKE